MRNLALLIFFLVSLYMPTVTGTAQAHPHVYVDASLVFVFDDNGLKEVQQNWLFDDIFSQAIMADLGLDASSLTTTIGQEKIRTGAFEFLVNFGYFTVIESAGREIPVTKPQGFKASLRNGRLVYDFTVPLDLSFDALQDFRMGVFDKEYYTDVVLVENGIAFEVDGMVQVSHAIRPARDHTYWKFIVPDMVHVAASGSPSKAPEPIDTQLAEEDGPGPIELVLSFVRFAQRELTKHLNTFGMELRDNPMGSPLWMFLALSFIYGVIHAVGPGHGKAVVCSYFMANPGSLVAGAIMGNAITFVHMLSAAVAVGAAYMIFSSGMGGFAQASLAIQPASYGLLALMGVFLVIKALRDIIRGGTLTSPSCDHHQEDEPDDLKSILAVSFVTGLIPCPGAAVILAFCIGLNLFWVGVMALIVMAMGMGLTTTLFAWFAVTARAVTFQLSSSNLRLINWLYAGLSIAGAGTIAVFGAALFYGSLSG